MWRPRTLLITDPNLGEAAHARLAPACADLTWICWDVARPAERADALARIAGDRWALAVSFYSDLILPPEALAAIALPLNIHPALPRIRGVGHDVVPLVERHAAVGATLHRMAPVVDTGEILGVEEAPLAPGHTHATLRTFNQGLSLRLLERLCALLAASPGPAELEARLRASGAAARHAWGAYYSRKAVAALRQRLEDDCASAMAGTARPAYTSDGDDGRQGS
jgi:methionyl-tRNA formyltransferase